MVLAAVRAKNRYPVSRTQEVVEQRGRWLIPDHYRWLENSSSLEVKSWIRKQNDMARGYLDGELRDSLIERLDGLPETPFFGEIICARHGRAFQLRQDGNKPFHVLHYSDVIDGSIAFGEWKPVLDPNTFSRDSSMALHSIFPSQVGKKVAFTVTKHGSDVTDIRVLDVESGEVLKDKVGNVVFTSVQWKQDEGGFYYTSWPAPYLVKSPRSVGQVFYHALGTPQSEDTEIFGRGLGSGKTTSVHGSDDHRYLMIHVSDNMHVDSYYMRLGEKGMPKVKPLHIGMNTVFFAVDIDENHAYAYTNIDAPKGRIIKVNLKAPSARNWETIVEEQDETLHSFIARCTNGDILAKYIDDGGKTTLKLFNKGGRLTSEVIANGIGTMNLFYYYPSMKIVAVSESSPIRPTGHYHLDMRTGEMDVIEESRFNFDFSNMMVKELPYQSKDGTYIKMTMVHKRGISLDGRNPTILYGYGGFNLAIEPEFESKILPFLEDGGVYVKAHIRGGGEGGEKWYMDGIHKNRQNSFDDFIAAAEFLIAQGYTSSDKLAVWGRSNGGWLATAFAVQRPDLCKAVIAEVPVTDLYRGDLYDIGILCRNEFGNPHSQRELNFILPVSPLHNVREGVAYPAVLLVSGELDTRAHPMHARKFAAALQNSTSSDNPVLLVTQMKAGHSSHENGGNGMGLTSERETSWIADCLTFVYTTLGVMPTTQKDVSIVPLRRAG